MNTLDTSEAKVQDQKQLRRANPGEEITPKRQPKRPKRPPKTYSPEAGNLKEDAPAVHVGRGCRHGEA